MAIISYKTFVEYFTTLAGQNNLLAGSIHVGDSWRIISAMRSSITYPTLWLERPIISAQFNEDQDTIGFELDFAFSILGGVVTDDIAAQEARLDQCERIMRQFIARLKRDSDLDDYDLILPARCESLATVMADDLYGWRIEGKMFVRKWTECYLATDWQGVPATGSTGDGGSAGIEPGDTFTIPAGELLDKLLIFSSTAQNVSVGTTAGGTEIVDAQHIPANGYYLHTEDVYAHNADRVLYFTATDDISIKYRKTKFS